jgi:hypothetical protein
MERESEYLEVCEGLKEVIDRIGEPLEGNCMYKHLSTDPWDCLENKRINYQKAVKGKQYVCEIGFNAGHSLVAMLLSNPTAHYVLFDLGAHEYTQPCYEYIKNKFPQTSMEMFWGDSRETVPDYHKNNPEKLFELVHIDGGHKHEVYSADWVNSLAISGKGALLIFDDTDNKKISDFIDLEIQKGLVIENKSFLKTFGYEHRVLIKE